MKLLYGFVLSFVVIVIALVGLYVFDYVTNTIIETHEEIVDSLNTMLSDLNADTMTPSHPFSETTRGYSAVLAVAAVALAFLPAVAYGLHLRRR